MTRQFRAEMYGDVSAEEARDELQRLIDDPDFHCSDRNKKFLTFVFEETLRGQGTSIKAYSIAVDVFGRPPSFDPAADPIVRIEATRLRTALAHYYDQYRHRSDIRIELPKGHYSPVFLRNSNTEVESEAADPAPRPAPPKAKGPVLGWQQIGLLGALALAAVVGATAPRPFGTSSITEKPSISIELASPGPAADDEARAIRDALVSAFARFQSFRIVSERPATTPSGEGEASPYLSTASDYGLRLRYERRAGERSVAWELVDRPTGDVLRAGEERLPFDRDGSADTTEELVARLAARLALAQGVVNTVETAREIDRSSLGNGCILRANIALRTEEQSELVQARRCLEQTLRIRPNDAGSHAQLAVVLLELDHEYPPGRLTDLAAEEAQRALVLAPDSDRSHYAQMTTQYRLGHVRAAILAGRRALELNPYNIVTKARLGSILFATGHWDEGVVLARQSVQFDFFAALPAETTLALDAYRREDYQAAAERLQHFAGGQCHHASLLTIAALGELGRHEEAAKEIARIRTERPDFEQSLGTDLSRWNLAPALTERLQAGLTKAGLVTPIPGASTARADTFAAKGKS